MTDLEWTAQQVLQLRQCIGFGHSAGVIAKALGCSRSAVLGKARRLGLRLGVMSGSALATRKTARRKSSAKPTQKVELGPVLTPAPPTPARKIFRPAHPIEITNLKTGMCRYPFGDEAPFFFCGVTTRDEKCSYCEEHAAICFGQPLRRSLAERAAYIRERTRAQARAFS